MANPFITRKRDISRELKALILATANLDRGAFISHADIESASGIKHSDPYYGRLVQRWKKHLRDDRGIKTKLPEIRGTGYVLATIEAQISEVADAHERRARRENRKAAESLTIIPRDDLNEQQIAFVHARLGQFVQIEETVKTNHSQSRQWISSPQTLPKIPQREKTARIG